MSTPVETTRNAGLIPAGTHTFRITEFEERMGPSAPYWNFTLHCEEGSDFDEKIVWTIVSLSPAARWKMENFLDAFGVEEGIQIQGEKFVGQLIRCSIIHEEYEGRIRERVENWLPMSKAGTVTPAHSSDNKSAAKTPAGRPKQSVPF